MAERRFSCVKQVVKTVQIPLPATFISNEISGIAEILDSWKRQYVKHLQGVVVNYKHYSLSSKTGFIAPNKPFVYYNVTATFDLFCPKVGDIVKGKIIRISNEHIGCLIDETINVTIHLHKDSPKDIQQFISLNRDILVEISSFNFDRRVIRVTGKITRKCIELMTDLFPPQTIVNFVDTPELSNNTDEGIGTSSESVDDRFGNHTLDDSKSNDDDLNFKKPHSSTTKSKKKSSKRHKSDSESSSMDTSDVSTSDEKSKKKKKKRDKSIPHMQNHASDNLLANAVFSNTLNQNYSNINHSEILAALKEEELSSESNTQSKKKRKRDCSPSLSLSKKRKRESESSFMDTSEQSTADEMPKKKKKRKDKNVPLEEKEIKNEPLDKPDNTVVTAALLSPKKEISSPLKTSKSKKNKKDKHKKPKEKSKSKKAKVHATGAVLKKDKKLRKKSSKKNGEQSKKHTKRKSHKKDEKDKKKKKKSSKHKITDIIKSEID